jgi:hypothetical protein
MGQFAWAPGAPFNGDPDEVASELDRIKRTGGLTPEAVVVVARPKRSVLHPYIFNVDEQVAAERYYVGRANSLINAIRVCDQEGETTHVRAFVSVPGFEEKRSYLSIDEEAARMQRAAFLRGRLLNIKTELRELDLYPQVGNGRSSRPDLPDCEPA